MAYIYSAAVMASSGKAQAHNQAVSFPEGSGRNGGACEGVRGSGPSQKETPWYPLELSKPYNDEFKFKIPTEWLRQEGTITPIMMGITGSSDFYHTDQENR